MSQISKLLRISVSKSSSCLLWLPKVKNEKFMKNYSSRSEFSRSAMEIPTKCSASLYVHNMYTLWSKDSKIVPPIWQFYFSNGGGPALWNQSDRQYATVEAIQGSSKASGSEIDNLIHDYMSVVSIIRNYQIYGHFCADLDPLGIKKPDITSERLGGVPDRIMRSYSLVNPDMNRVYKLPPNTKIGGTEGSLPLKEIIARLEKVYCGHFGTEYMYIENRTHCDFIREKIETPGAFDMTKDEKNVLLSRLLRTDGFEAFLSKKWFSEKRFGLEGCEVMIPLIKHVIDVSSNLGVDYFIIGMAHRGRLNALANILRKPLFQIFAQFIGLEPGDVGAGDVKYHLGTYTERINRLTNKKIELSLNANPSHLEVVNALVLGRAKAHQYYRNDSQGKTVMPILIHGDAAICGQGILYEIFHLSDLPHYKTGGTMHIVCNNQIGFTTDPRFHRSSTHPSDIARVTNVPVFHFNADNPEVGMLAGKVAAEYRAKFSHDVVIDLVGYRRHGHSEVDEPTYTHPLMYNIIRLKKPVAKLYGDQLIKEGVTTDEIMKKYSKHYEEILETDFQKAKKETNVKVSDWIDCPWPGFGTGEPSIPTTGVSEDILKHIGAALSTPPPNFDLHKGLTRRVLTARQKLVAQRKADWALGEAFGIGSILHEKIHVRLSGEDVQRGTFAHRHHVYHHQSKDGERYHVLDHLWPGKQGQYVVSNSSLSEYGVLGFEVGYANTNPNALIIWEAQFGDFSNMAQAIIDLYLCAAEHKWARQCGIVCWLPHGMEGMGPEHSSARPERFLQMTADDPDVMPKETPDVIIRQLKESNWILANLSTPANMFHILRRQVKMSFRKPLVIFTPKSLLRHPLVISSFDEMKEGTSFRYIYPEEGPAAADPGGVKKIVFCCGKFYWDALAQRGKAKKDKEIALCRIEQLYPFPYYELKKEVAKYPKAAVCWGQEEHKNQGYWSYTRNRLETLLRHMKDNRTVTYIGRESDPSPASGNKVQHLSQVRKLFEDLLSV